MGTSLHSPWSQLRATHCPEGVGQSVSCKQPTHSCSALQKGRPASEQGTCGPHSPLTPALPAAPASASEAPPSEVAASPPAPPDPALPPSASDSSACPPSANWPAMLLDAPPLGSAAELPASALVPPAAGASANWRTGLQYMSRQLSNTTARATLARCLMDMVSARTLPSSRDSVTSYEPTTDPCISRLLRQCMPWWPRLCRGAAQPWQSVRVSANLARPAALAKARGGARVAREKPFPSRSRPAIVRW